MSEGQEDGACSGKCSGGRCCVFGIIGLAVVLFAVVGGLTYFLSLSNGAQRGEEALLSALPSSISVGGRKVSGEVGSAVIRLAAAVREGGSYDGVLVRRGARVLEEHIAEEAKSALSKIVSEGKALVGGGARGESAQGRADIERLADHAAGDARALAASAGREDLVMRAQVLGRRCDGCHQ